jgi:hypothetical protein
MANNRPPSDSRYAPPGSAGTTYIVKTPTPKIVQHWYIPPSDSRFAKSGSAGTTYIVDKPGPPTVYGGNMNHGRTLTIPTMTDRNR